MWQRIFGDELAYGVVVLRMRFETLWVSVLHARVRQWSLQDLRLGWKPVILRCWVVPNHSVNRTATSLRAVASGYVKRWAAY
jgi:hypothetical protein